MSSRKMKPGKGRSSQPSPSTKKSKKSGKSIKSRAARASMGGASVAISEDLQQFTRFSGRGDSLVMHTCAAIAQLARDRLDTTEGVIQPSSGNYVSLQLNLTSPAGLTGAGTKVNSGFVSPVFDLIASAFVRYRIRMLKFHYEPQSPTTVEGRMVFAFADDPMHPVLWNAVVPTSTGLLALSDSIAFAPWRSWTMDVTHKVTDQLFYTFTDPSTTVASFAERFSDFGVISCTSQLVGNVNAVAGVLYMEAQIELVEFCPISLSAPTASFLSRKLDDQEAKYKQPSSSSRCDKTIN